MTASDGRAIANKYDETNTLILVNVPSELFAPNLLAALRRCFAAYGSILAWAPLHGFRRIIAVYELDAQARAAKVQLDRSVIEDGSQADDADAIPR